MVKQKTHEQFLIDFYNKNDKAQNIEILDKYSGSQVKIKCKCKICNLEWYMTPSNLLQNEGCPDCFRKRKKKTHQQFIEEMACINPNIEILTEYKGRAERVDCVCKICGYRWDAKAGNLLSGKGCKKCADRNLSIIKKKTHEKFIEDLKKRNKYFDTFEILDKYINDDTKLKCCCNECGSIWYVTPRSLNQGHSCPNCNKSRGEERIDEYLNLIHIDYEPQKRFKDLKGIGNKLLSYDYYIPSYNLLIEYQGKQHYKPVDVFGGENQLLIQQEHDKRKKMYACDNNYNFLEIPYWEYDNVENILNEKLKEVRQNGR